MFVPMAPFYVKAPLVISDLRMYAAMVILRVEEVKERNQRNRGLQLKICVFNNNNNLRV